MKEKSELMLTTTKTYGASTALACNNVSKCGLLHTSDGCLHLVTHQSE